MVQPSVEDLSRPNTGYNPSSRAQLSSAVAVPTSSDTRGVCLRRLGVAVRERQPLRDACARNNLDLRHMVHAAGAALPCKRAVPGTKREGSLTPFRGSTRFGSRSVSGRPALHLVGRRPVSGGAVLGWIRGARSASRADVPRATFNPSCARLLDRSPLAEARTVAPAPENVSTFRRFALMVVGPRSRCCVASDYVQRSARSRSGPDHCSI